MELLLLVVVAAFCIFGFHYLVAGRELMDTDQAIASNLSSALREIDSELRRERKPVILAVYQSAASNYTKLTTRGYDNEQIVMLLLAQATRKEKEVIKFMLADIVGSKPDATDADALELLMADPWSKVYQAKGEPPF